MPNRFRTYFMQAVSLLSSKKLKLKTLIQETKLKIQTKEDKLTQPQIQMRCGPS